MNFTEIALQKPRLSGLVLIIIGGLLVLLNIGFIMYKEFFFDKLFAAGFAIISAGIWILATGKTYPKGIKAPVWYNIGAVIFTLAGLAGGVYVSEILDYRSYILL